MEQHDFEDLINQVRQISRHLARVYQEVTGEELDVEGLVRHYPLIAVGVAAGLGALGGWLVGRGSTKQLPSSPPGPSPIEYLERLLPESIEKMRDILPGVIPEEAVGATRAWMDDMLESRLREGVDSLMSGVAETRLGAFLKQTIQRLDSGEEHELDDPE